MVLRNDSEDERDPLLDDNEDTISEESMSSISSVYSYKNVLVGEEKILFSTELLNLFIFRCNPFTALWGPFYSKQFYHQPVSSHC